MSSISAVEKLPSSLCEPATCRPFENTESDSEENPTINAITRSKKKELEANQ